jgi:hypothetical protein
MFKSFDIPTPNLFQIKGPSWLWSYGSCNRCLSPLTLWVGIPRMLGVLDSTLCVKVCQWLVAGWWFSLGVLDSTLCVKVCRWLVAGWWFSLGVLDSTLCVKVCQWLVAGWWFSLGVLDSTLCVKVCRWLVAGWWFSPGTPVSPSNKTWPQHYNLK